MVKTISYLRGTSPQDAIEITGVVPSPESFTDFARREAVKNSLEYMGLAPGTPLTEVKIDKVFIGSCTNARIEDLRSAASIVQGKKIAPHVYAMVVPGSGLVKKQAIAEGLDVIFTKSGFDFREAGCSMCLGMNEDQLKPFERCASTSNRNFEGRQGFKGRTHLMSPSMAAAAAIKGYLADVREFSVKSPVEVETDPKTYLTPATELPPSPTKFERSATTGGMSPFTTLTGIACPIPMSNIDTDKLTPKQFLKTITRSGLKKALFYELRFKKDGSETDFILNTPPFNQSKILIAGENFGCGSSREHAPWALLDFGIRCIIAPSFADIFENKYVNLFTN